MHGVHDAVLPTQLLTTPAGEKYPDKQAHGTGCAAPPWHTAPAGHVLQVPVVELHAIDDKAVEAYPAMHVQALACALLPAHDSPAPHALHVDNTPAQDKAVFDEDA